MSVSMLQSWEGNTYLVLYLEEEELKQLLITSLRSPDSGGIYRKVTEMTRNSLLPISG